MGYTRTDLNDEIEITLDETECKRVAGRQRGWEIFALALMIVLPFVVYLPVTTGYATFAGFDHTGINQPLKMVAFESLRNGDMPLWEHAIDRGMPLFAEGEAGLFYPLNLLFLLPGDFLTIYNIVVLLCLSIAGVLFYLWIRKLGVGRISSTLAAIAHQFGATVNFNKANMNILEGYILAPLALLLLEKIGSGDDGRDRPLMRTAGLGLVFAAMIFAGQAQYVVYTGLFCAVYIIVRVIFAGRSGYRDVLMSMGLPFAGGIVLGGGVAAVQLLPMLELIPLSERGIDSLYGEMAVRGLWLSPDRLFATFIFPAYHHSLDNFLPYLSTTVYVGPVALMLAGYAIRFRGRLPRGSAAVIIPLAITGLIFLWLAMGSNAPGAGWLTSQGLFGSFRGHGRLGGYFAMVVILLMGMGLDVFLKTTCKDVCDMVGSRICLPLFAVQLVVMGLLTIPFITQRTEFLETRVTLGLMVGMVMIFFTAILVGNLLRTRIPAAVGVVIVIAMQIIGFQTTSSETLLERKSWDVDRSDLLYISENSRNPDQGSMVAIRTQASVRIHERVLERGFAALEGGSHNHIDHLGSANAGIMDGLVVCNADLPLEIARWEWLVHRELWPMIETTKGDIGTLGINLIDKLGINWIVTENGDLEVGDWEKISGEIFTNREIPYYIYRRAALVSDGSYYQFFAPKHSFYWDWISAPEGGIESTIRENYIEFLESERNPNRVYIEGLDAREIPVESDERSGTASLSEWVNPTEYKVVVSGLTSEAIFVFRDQWYPGWSVTVNGEDAELLRADLVFKAVKLGEGRSEVVFKYRSGYLMTGWVVTIIGLILIIGLSVFEMMYWKKSTYDTN